jgi:hypothetical protein
MPPNPPLPPFGSPTKIHGMPPVQYNGQVDREILVPVSHIQVEDAYYRQNSYGMMPDSRGSVVSTSHGHPQFHDYHHSDRSRRPTLSLGPPTPIMQPIYHSPEPTSHYNTGEVAIVPMSRGNTLTSTSSAHMNDESFTQSQPYLLERQLPPPHPSVSVQPNLYDMSQRSSTLYLGAHAPWPTQYSYMRTPIPNDIERNSVSSYRSSSFAESNSYSIPNTSQSSISVDVDYNGNDHRNGTITTRPTMTLAEPIRCSEPVMTYEMRKGPESIEVPVSPLNDHHNAVEGNANLNYGKDSKVYSWNPHYKCHSYGEVSNCNPLQSSESCHVVVDDGSSKKTSQLKSRPNSTGECGPMPSNTSINTSNLKRD